MNEALNTETDLLAAHSRRVLLSANITMIITIIIHDIDHIRQAIELCYTIGLPLWLVNISVYTPSLIALALIWFGWRGGAVTTCINGILVGTAFAEIHLWRPSIPIWGLWNDNFFILGVDWISWTILALTVLIGVGVAMAGTYVLGLNWRRQVD